MTTTVDSSINDNDKLYPIYSYMNKEVIGNYALSNTKLPELRITSSGAVIRYVRTKKSACSYINFDVPKI